MEVAPSLLFPTRMALLGCGYFGGSRRRDMAETKTAVAQKPRWVDLSTSDADAARDYYAMLFGWKVEVNPDPQYGGYALAKIGGKDVAGIGPKQTPEGPSAWMVYIGTTDAADTAKKAEAAGGKVIAPPFPVGDQGSMAVIQDPSGAFFGLWQPKNMPGAEVQDQPNTFGWSELNARGVDKAVPFYKKLFGWGDKKSEMSEGQPYTEFLLGGESIAGGMEMQAPQDFPGGRFAILSDPQGAAFGLLKMKPTQK